MRILFVHQNFPGQFRHIATALAAAPEHQVMAITDEANLQRAVRLHPNITIAAYRSPKPGGRHTHAYLRDSEAHVRRGQQALRAAMDLAARGIDPQLVVVHPGWGEALFLKEAFPLARHIHYCEYFYGGADGDSGFDPEFHLSLDDRLNVQVRNTTQLLSLVHCDAAVAPTAWQRSRYPAPWQARIEVLHEGIDTARVAPDGGAELRWEGRVFRAGEEIVTYVARNLEPYRGFHTFMRCLARLQALRPHARILIVGDDKVSYGKRLPEGESYKKKYIAELDACAEAPDWSRIHFLGPLAYADFVKVLQVSAVHVYLTYPFVLSWSVLEAMAAGCLVLASDTAPVRDIVSDGDNAILTDFFDHAALADKLAALLQDPARYTALRARAREYCVREFDLRTRCLPAWRSFLERQGDA